MQEGDEIRLTVRDLTLSNDMKVTHAELHYSRPRRMASASEQYRVYLHRVSIAYEELVRQYRVAFAGFRSDERNWEQIESEEAARKILVSRDTLIPLDSAMSVRRRTFFHKNSVLIKIVDLVEAGGAGGR